MTRPKNETTFNRHKITMDTYKRVIEMINKAGRECGIDNLASSIGMEKIYDEVHKRHKHYSRSYIRKVISNYHKKIK